MKTRRGTIYVVVVLGEGGIAGNMNDMLTTSCTNKFVLSELTGISRDRLAYLFTRQGKKFILEQGHLIIRVDHLYPGRQIGGKKKEYSGFNRNI
jgi:hypothetical protein